MTEVKPASQMTSLQARPPFESRSNITTPKRSSTCNHYCLDTVCGGRCQSSCGHSTSIDIATTTIDEYTIDEQTFHHKTG